MPLPPLAETTQIHCDSELASKVRGDTTAINAFHNLYGSVGYDVTLKNNENIVPLGIALAADALIGPI